MERDEFTNVDEPWWLIEQEVTPMDLSNLRDELATARGWDTYNWFTQKTLLEELFQDITNQNQRLLTELDEATDEYKQQAWLQEIVALFAETPSEEHGKEEEHEGAEGEHEAAQDEAPKAEDHGTWNDDWEMLYRVDADGSYQYAFSDDKQTVRAGTEWMSTEEATAAKAGGGAGEAEAASAPAEEAPKAAEPEGGGAEAAGVAAAEVTWDAQWGMFLRFADGKYEYSLSNMLSDGPGVDTPAGQADGTWHGTAEEASAARQQVVELKDTFSELVANPDVPISEEDLNAALQDPDFQKNLAEADAALEAELAALEAEG